MVTRTNRVPVPLGWVRKDIEHRFQVTVDGKASARLTREKDARAALATLQAIMPKEARGLLSLAGHKALGDICYGFPSERDFEVIAGTGQEFGGQPPLWSPLRSLIRDDDQKALSLAFQNDLFVTYLMQFTTSFLPIVEIDFSKLDNRRSFFVTFELISGQTGRAFFSALSQRRKERRFRLRTVPARFGLSKIPFWVKMSGAMEAQREHLRIHLPEGMQLASPPYIVVDSSVSPKRRVELSNSTHYSATLNTLAVYRHRDGITNKKLISGAESNYNYRISIIPKLSGFVWSALLSLIAGATCLLLLFLLHWFRYYLRAPYYFDDYGFRVGDFSSVLQFLFLGTSLITAWSVQSDKADQRVGLLAKLRMLVVAVLCVNVSVGLYTAIFGRVLLSWVYLSLWIIAFLFNFAVISLLLKGIYDATRAKSRLLPLLGRTYNMVVIGRDQTVNHRPKRLLRRT